MNTNLVASLVARCEMALASGRERRDGEGRAFDDDEALAELTQIMTAEAGEVVEALGFGAANGGPVPMVVIAGSDWGAFVACEILSTCAGLVAVHQREEPADALWPQYPNGQVITAFARPVANAAPGVEAAQVAEPAQVAA